jgi:hypothetical protein
LTSAASSALVRVSVAKIRLGPDEVAIPGTFMRMRGPSSTMPASVTPTVSMNAERVQSSAAAVMSS